MPRRRPPLTTREIAAYLAGARLCRAWQADDGSWSPTKAAIVSRLAEADATVLCSLGARRWWRWFDRGWTDAEWGPR